MWGGGERGEVGVELGWVSGVELEGGVEWGGGRGDEVEMY